MNDNVTEYFKEIRMKTICNVELGGCLLAAGEDLEIFE